MRPRQLLLLLSCVLLCASLVPAAASAATAKQRMLSALNSARAANGAPKVRTYSPLAKSSTRYATYMLANDVWAHASNPARGAGVSSVGEILGMTTTASPAPRAIVRAWMASPVHRPILLDRHYRYVGLGLRHGDLQGTTAWVWVVRFGAR